PDLRTLGPSDLRMLPCASVRIVTVTAAIILPLLAVQLGAQGRGRGGAPAGAPGQGGRNAAASPASPRPPQSSNAQTYSAEQVAAGRTLFGGQCGFCHGRDAAGGESGPDLTRSTLVSQDVRGDRIGPVVKTGRTDKGMPAFPLNDTDLNAIVAFIHDQQANAA